MKTLLFIGVLVAVISCTSALQCWGGACVFPGKTLDKNNPLCSKEDCGDGGCLRITAEKSGKASTTLSCSVGPGDECKESGGVTTCVCKTALCNGADGTSYTHLIITFIVGAIFFR